jgi:hypothetical protein
VVDAQVEAILKVALKDATFELGVLSKIGNVNNVKSLQRLLSALKRL